MTKSKIISISLLILSPLAALGQNGVRMPDPFDQLTRQEKRTLQSQASSMFNALEPAVKNTSKHTVSIYTLGRRIAFGTAVRTKDAKTAVLTKWSEVSQTRGPINIVTADGKTHAAIVAGVYPEHDLALVNTKASLDPLDLTNSATPELGSFLALSRPDGKVEGIGVVSVQARSLREKDKAYLGVMMDFSQAGKDGVPLQRVMPDSAAMKAGLRNGDVIFSVDQNQITGAMEMRNILQRLEPGSEITVRYRRGKNENNATVQLGSRADNADIRRVPPERMNRMQSMGTKPSRVRSDFPSVIQSDMAVDSNDMGAPVVDLNGKLVGIAIARGSRIKTFMIPADTLVKVLAFDATPVEQAMAMKAKPSSRPNGMANRGLRPTEKDDDPAARVRRLLGEIEKNNRQNEGIMREVEEHLRALEEAEKRR
ncbi:MAG: PDZ domain-containing protein [Akkermansiaceae bacterium]